MHLNPSSGFDISNLSFLISGVLMVNKYCEV